MESIMNMPKPTHPTKRQWDAARQTITELYVDKNMSLNQLMEFMAKEHHFKATRKMYKARFKQWGAWKHLRPYDVAKIRGQLKSTANNDRPKQILVRGAMVDPLKASRYLRRRVRTAAELEDPLGVLPPLPPAADAKQAPQDQDLFNAVSKYLDFLVPVVTWNATQKDRWCVSTTAGAEGRFRVNLFRDTMVAAVTLNTPDAPNTLTESVSFIHACMDVLREMLVDQDPFLLASVLDVFSHLSRQKHVLRDFRHYLEDTILSQITNLTTLVSGTEHPLSKVWLALGTIERRRRPHLLARGMGLVHARFADILGPDHVATQLIHFQMLTCLEDIAGQDTVLTSLVNTARCNILLTPDSYQLRFAVGGILLHRGHPAEITDLISEMDNRLHQTTILGNSLLSYEYDILLGMWNSKFGDRTVATRRLQDAVILSEMSWGAITPVSVFTLTRLENHHRRWGDKEAVDALGMERVKRFSQRLHGQP